MRFIVDEDVPKSASDFLIQYGSRHGHAVILVPNVLLPGSDDHLIAKWAHENVAIVVTCNVRHFQGLLQRPNYSQAGLLGLPQPNAKGRLELLMDLIEAEGAIAADAGRVWIEIREATILLRR